MGDTVLTRDGPVAVPLDYTVPASGELLPLMVRATMDGTSASGSFYAVVQVLSPNGRVMGTARSDAIAAGASADVTWFPGGGQLGAGQQRAVGARIQNNLGQTIINDTWTTLAYERSIYDTDGMVNLGADNTKLFVNTSGLYMVVASTEWQGNNSGKRSLAVTHNDFMTNGAISEDNYVFDQRMPVWDRLTGLVDQPQTIQQVVSFWQANAGDFFATGAFQLSGSSVGLGLHGYTYFAATLMGT